VTNHPNPEPDPADGQPRYETQDANLATIVFVGCTLVACAVVIHVALWGLFRYWDKHDVRAKTSSSPLVREEMNQLPAEPRLEAFEPNRAWLFLRTSDDKEESFYVDTAVTVERIPKEGERAELKLFALRPGTEVALTYQNPQGLPGRPRVVRIETGEGRAAGTGRPAETGLITIAGRLVRIVPTGGADWRVAAEIRLGQYGWVDEKKQIAHIPIDEAMRILAERRLLKSEPVRGDRGERENPESSSGRGSEEGKR
jgi:hypothetical protein